MTLTPLPALSDNYIWMMAGLGRGTVVVDPGDAAPVIAATSGSRPDAVLLTHHHPDHVGGVGALLERWPDLDVIGPADPRITGMTRSVGEADLVEVAGWTFQVLAIPGHTLTHIAFHGEGVLFCGDTLFSLGCGRLFEGSPAQMLASLDRLAALPTATAVCCGHEYTLANAAFARTVEPDNPALKRRSEEAAHMRAAGRPTLPTTIADERAANPFLRVDTTAVQAAIADRLGRIPADRTEAFATLRGWKDGFRA